MAGMHLLKIIAAALLIAFLTCPALAQVSGPCANCHTMHNSQNGEDVYEGTTPVINHRALLNKDCVGCHSAASGDTWQDPVTGAPIVYNSSEPTYGADAGDGKNQGLAAGNFYWVDVDEANGHNIFSPDSKHTVAPGRTDHGCIGSDSCHENLDRVYTYLNAHYGKQACTKCHMIDWRKENWHHSDDSDNLILTRDQGWYRFLSSHNENKGVRGIEDPDWEHTVSSTDHNEYLGYESSKYNDRAGISHYTTTAFCTGCHNAIHIQDDTYHGASPWLRHPADQELPASGEYANYTTYDPLVPVARPALSTVSDTVTPGTDMVMCLSCHRAHGSPYPDMLRFDYNMQAGGGESSDGCFKCHSAKDGS